MSLFPQKLDFYIKGGVSGMFGVILSHPIDTIKTHIQSGKQLSKINFSPASLYKGISAPLIGVGIEKAIVFGVYNYAKRELQLNIPLSGAIAGLAASIIVTPYERIKILKQSQQTLKKMDIISPQFLFKGLSATFTREVPGFAIYFTVFEACKYHWHTKYNKTISYLNAFCYGGLSGFTAWVFIYPQDRIKTLMQLDMSKSSGKMDSNSFAQIATRIYNAGGIASLYKGFNFAVLRAITLHSGTFFMMELLTS
uniref:Mitochondrial carrier protein n=1 Tax=viral metagenome TaxID=1070528 RepID=A0A6C0HLT0_9ZZZZ